MLPESNTVRLVIKLKLSYSLLLHIIKQAWSFTCYIQTTDENFDSFLRKHSDKAKNFLFT
jgi:hypothetical protein